VTDRAPRARRDGRLAAEDRRRFRLRAMTRDDLAQVLRIERDSFEHPWPKSAFENELDVPFSRSQVVHPSDAPGKVVGYIVRWHVADEMHLLNLATAPSVRGLGLGRRLLRLLLAEARRKRATVVTLEVSEGNTAARSLYESLGFRVVRKRRDYYAPRHHALVAEWTP
jgi:ribosomal-protein-alanine N-acetyltransferase